MKKQASKIQQVNSMIANKQYKDAFKVMYRDELDSTTISKGCHAVQKLMEERTNGNFLRACAIFENAIQIEEEKINSQRNSAKVRDFKKKYNKWESGYSMGETVEVVYMGNLCLEKDVVNDSKREYNGSAKKWNRNVKYGSTTMFVDLTGSRAKYRVEVVER